MMTIDAGALRIIINEIRKCRAACREWLRTLKIMEGWKVAKIDDEYIVGVYGSKKIEREFDDFDTKDLIREIHRRLGPKGFFMCQMPRLNDKPNYGPLDEAMREFENCFQAALNLREFCQKIDIHFEDIAWAAIASYYGHDFRQWVDQMRRPWNER